MALTGRLEMITPGPGRTSAREATQIHGILVHWSQRYSKGRTWPYSLTGRLKIKMVTPGRTGGREER